MADCQLLKTCPFFEGSLKKMPALADTYRERYCRGDSSRCGRHMIFLAKGRAAVPGNLFPNEVDRALYIIQFGQEPP